MSTPLSTSLLSIEKLTASTPAAFPAYFVVSTAPINVEDRVEDPPMSDRQTEQKDPQVDISQAWIDEIAGYLKQHKKDAEILIVIHGYNTSKASVKKWIESIYQHIQTHCKSCPNGFLLIGYRWPSEQIIASEPENLAQRPGKWAYLKAKWNSAKQALPVILGKISFWGTLGLIGGTIALIIGVVEIVLGSFNAVTFLILSSTLIISSIVSLSPIVTILLLRLAGYFRDNYRANNFGVPDLVELIRQIDHALTKDAPEGEKDWGTDRIKLSFIGHSMGGFVVTNAVRILSDVFDSRSVGTLDAKNPEKKPSREIGNVFSLGRLVLVSPDIPAETIISGRANFLQSSLRRFEEAYLFSNEGDMALRLASTAANYFSYPAKTQAGGYRLGNVTLRTSVNGTLTPATRPSTPEAVKPKESYGMIVRLPNGLLVRLQDGKLYSLLDGQIARVDGGQLIQLENQHLVRLQDGQLRSILEKQIVRLPNGQLFQVQQGTFVSIPAIPLDHQNKEPIHLQEGETVAVIWNFPLDYLFIKKAMPLSQRQNMIALAPAEKPIGEFFTFFDCTDYREPYLDQQGKELSKGVVSHAKRKQALTFQDYVSLTIDYFSGKIDTHGGYFGDGERDPKQGLKPEAAFTKLAIYGLACLGFEKFLLDLKTEGLFTEVYTPSFQQALASLDSSSLTAMQKEKVALSYILSSICQEKGIQVLLSEERYAQDVLGQQPFDQKG